MISTQYKLYYGNKRSHHVIIWKKINVVIFYLLNNFIYWFEGNITLLTEVSKPVNSNHNCSFKQIDLIPITQKFSIDLG